MTQEDKELLLKDLCSRLPYNVKVAVDYKTYLEWLPDDDEDSHYKEHFNILLEVKGKTIEGMSLEPQTVCSYPCRERFITFRGCNDDYGIPVELIRPYLRPMESMTEEERDEFRKAGGVMSYSPQHDTWAISAFAQEAYDWLNKKMFDYRHLIPMGLALPAKEGMYN